MAQEIQLPDGEFVSSKRAADLLGYSQDYVGQLARGGQIRARRISGLWYVDLESIKKHKEQADLYQPVPPGMQGPGDLESIVMLDGKNYVSAARASQITGYNQDYVGQLARGGKVLSRQIGNRWYVEKEGIAAHKSEKDALLAAVQRDAVGLGSQTQGTAQTLGTLTTEKSIPEPFFTYIPQLNVAKLPELSLEEKRTSEIIDTRVTEEQKKPVNTTRISSDAPASAAVTPVPIHIRNMPVVAQRMPMSSDGMKISPHKEIVRTARLPKKPLIRSAIAAFTVLVFLGLGVSTIAEKGIYGATKKISSENLTASAASALDTIGSILEQLFSREQVYSKGE